MKKIAIIIIGVGVAVAAILLAIIIYFVFRPNPYCDSSLCPAGEPNIGCYGNFWGDACISPEVIPITSKMEQDILDAHNTYRNDIASGKLTNKYGATFPMAERMGTLKWNNELAYLAKLNTYQCIMQHDKCRNTKQFKHSGQNLGYGTATSDPMLFINSIITSWFTEHEDTDIAVIKSYANPPASQQIQIGHFTVMIQDLQTAVGCGMTSTMKNNRKYFVFACNYSYTNMLGTPVYVADTTTIPCHACIKGCHPSFVNLCASGEDIRSP